jgi:hypothetical protein
MDCTIEFDLELDDGTPCGSYCCCSKACAAESDENLGGYCWEVEPSPPPPEVPREQLGFDFKATESG